MSFHDVNDLAAAVAQIDFCLLLESFEAAVAGLLLALIALRASA